MLRPLPCLWRPPPWPISRIRIRLPSFGALSALTRRCRRHPLPTPSVAPSEPTSRCPDVISEVELTQYQLERELRDARDRVRHLEQTLHCVFTVVKPCAGNGAGR
jgi:hypothetical protein